MSEEEKPRTVTLRFTTTDYAPKKLSARIEEFKKRNRPVKMDAREEAIHFLRGTAARASFVLPALYLALGARSQPQTSRLNHWQRVHAAGLEQSALQTISLACRSIFDENNGRLSGKKISNLSDEVLNSVAAYWAGQSKLPIEDARRALLLLKRLFAKCAHPEKVLIDRSSLLERRIGLLKFYAHRQVAHISLGDYLFDILDLIHVTAAIVIIGAIILEFDDPSRANNYFDEVDEGGWRAAKEVFPTLEIDRIFKNWNILRQARLNWKIPELDGVGYILNQLPSAIGYWDSDKDE